MKNSFAPEKSDELRHRLGNSWQSSYQWFVQTPDRALAKAYKAALAIKSIEEEHFNGNKVSTESKNYSKSILDCFQADVDKYLKLIKINLTEFKFSRLLFNKNNYNFRDKLNFIDEIYFKYNTENKPRLENQNSRSDFRYQMKNNKRIKRKSNSSFSEIELIDLEPVTEKNGVLPRSIGRTIRKIKTELDNNTEEQLVQNFRHSKKTTRAAFKCLLLLILIPLLTQQISKQFLLFPLVQNFRAEQDTPIFINLEMKEEALRKLQSFEEELKFQSLIEENRQVAPDIIEVKIKDKAKEIADEFREKSNNAVSNVFADLLGLVAFAGVLLTNRPGITAIKTLLDSIVYDLSDSAKAFIIILFTDIFVGFHSPHGWEVILEGIANHLGLPANKSLIFLFIATFPVVLDTIFKYWIFRYLNRISPSAVATLKNMNE